MRTSGSIRHCAGDDPIPAALDEFIPQPDVGDRQEVVVRAPADLVFEVASQFDLQSIPLIRFIFWLRAALLGARVRGGWKPAGLVAETRAMGWGALKDQPGRLYIAGAACQPWQADVHFTPLTPESFPVYAEPDQVKIAWSLEAEPLEPGVTRFATETRVIATDAEAHRKFKRYWRTFGICIVGIRWLLLPRLRRLAERRARAAARS